MSGRASSGFPGPAKPSASLTPAGPQITGPWRRLLPGTVVPVALDADAVYALAYTIVRTTFGGPVRAARIDRRSGEVVRSAPFPGGSGGLLSAGSLWVAGGLGRRGSAGQSHPLPARRPFAGPAAAAGASRPRCAGSRRRRARRRPRGSMGGLRARPRPDRSGGGRGADTDTDRPGDQGPQRRSWGRCPLRRGGVGRGPIRDQATSSDRSLAAAIGRPRGCLRGRSTPHVDERRSLGLLPHRDAWSPCTSPSRRPPAGRPDRARAGLEPRDERGGGLRGRGDSVDRRRDGIACADSSSGELRHAEALDGAGTLVADSAALYVSANDGLVTMTPPKECAA